MNKSKQMVFTQAQLAAVNALAAATGETYADMIRRLLIEESKSRGIIFPDDMRSKVQTMAQAQAARWPKRPEPWTMVVFVQGETEGSGERRREMTIEAADEIASVIVGEDIRMRFNEDVRVDGAFPHTMRGSFIWIELIEK